MYNPFILGFDESEGPIIKIRLQEAKERFGEFPSKYKNDFKNYENLSKDRDPEKRTEEEDERKKNKVLNLDLGINIKKWFKQNPQDNLKRFVNDFFDNWHRDYFQEFQIDIAPLVNLNNQVILKDFLKINNSFLESIYHLDIRSFLQEKNIIRRDIFNSISEEKLLDKCIQIIERKMRNNPKNEPLNSLLNNLRIKKILKELSIEVGSSLDSILIYPTKVYADEISNALAKIASFTPLQGIKDLSYRKGKGFELDYAPRDRFYLELGRDFGDCTSNQERLQNEETENIFWTVFPWILDRNYQILVVYLDGVRLLKIHLLPLYLNLSEQGQEPFHFLCVDAIESTPSFHKKQKNDLSFNPKDLFNFVVSEVLNLASRMRIEVVYCEKFSNTPWVRDELEKYPEIYLDTRQIIKIDELEDVFECANLFCGSKLQDSTRIKQIFMEIQAKNTYLIPNSPTHFKGTCKSFSVLGGNEYRGIPINYLFGI